MTIAESKPYDLMSNLPNHLIMDIIKLADGGLNTHRKKYKSVLDSIKEPLKYYDDGGGGNGEYFGHFKNKGRSLENIEQFWLENLYVEDSRELVAMESGGLYEVLCENYVEEGSIIGIWG